MTLSSGQLRTLARWFSWAVVRIVFIVLAAVVLGSLVAIGGTWGIVLALVVVVAAFWYWFATGGGGP